MKKVLWISYLFPPLNCGVGRQVKIAKYLPDYGWLPIVLSVKKSRLRPLYDISLLNDIADNVEVHRTWSFESKLLMTYLPYLLHFNPKWISIPDSLIGWFPFAVKEGLNIIKSQKPDAIFSSSMPLTCHLIAYALKQRTGLPWVADFRDPWTQNTYISYPRPIFRLENRMEAAVIKAADRMTTVNDPIKQDFQNKYSKEPVDKFIAISHGFDLEDFGNNEYHLGNKPSIDRFTLTYAGSIYGKGKGITFINAIKELTDEDNGFRTKLHIRFVGNAVPIRRLCDELNLQQVVTFTDMVTHKEAWSYLLSSDVLLFVLRGGELDKKVPTGKLFEYMAIGKPVLALAPEGEAANIIRQTNIGVVVNPEDKQGIKRTVREMYEKWLCGNLSINPNKEVINQYDIRELSRRFAMIFDELVQEES